jgi:lipoprotein-anchoring transpeptidase ErfK/SrfK
MIELARRFPRRTLAALLTASLAAGVGVGMLIPAASASDSTPPAAPAVAASPSPTPTPTPTATPEVTPTPAIDVSVVGAEGPRPAKYKKPKPATRTKKARNVPLRPLDDGDGRRIVYDKTLMHVWLMDENDTVVKRFPVVGRWDRPVMGTYKIYSQSERSGNPNSGVTFDHMTRFAYGLDGKTPIGFHSIPIYYDGRMMHDTDQLGLPVATGGCVRMAAEDAEFLYKWAEKGDTVVVLPSP